MPEHMDPGVVGLRHLPSHRTTVCTYNGKTGFNLSMHKKFIFDQNQNQVTNTYFGSFKVLEGQNFIIPPYNRTTV